MTFVILAKFYWNIQINNCLDICHLRRTEVHTGLNWGNLKKRDHFGDSGVGTFTVLSQTEIRWEGVDWINLSLDRRK